MDRAAANHPHQSKAGNKNIIKYFKRAATFTIPSGPYGPGHDRGFSGPMVPLVPAAARRRREKDGRGKGLDIHQEPTSPKVSCIGQVKKHKGDMWRLASMRGEVSQDYNNKTEKEKKEKKKEKPSSSSTVLSTILKGKFRRNEKAEAAHLLPRPPVAPVQAPSIGQMKKFASGRDKLDGFEWKTAAIHGDDDSSNYESADEGESEEERKEKEHEIISRSGLTVTGEEKRKEEVNLWKRRMTKPPLPLQLS